MFSKNKDFLGVVSNIEDSLKDLDNYVSHKKTSRNEFEVKFKSNNSGQILTVRVFAFDLSVIPNAA